MVTKAMSYILLVTAGIWIDVAKSWYLYGLWPSSWGLYAAFTLAGVFVSVLLSLWKAEFE